MFVPSVVVALLAVVSPPAAAAKGHKRDSIGKGTGSSGGIRKSQKIKRAEMNKE